LYLETLSLRNFRNYEEARVEFSPRVNVFLGRNAQGKTNLLEAVHLLAIGRSFRPAGERELTRHGCDAFRVVGEFVSENGVMSSVEYIAGAEGKSIRQNGVALRRAQDLFGRVNVVLFSPDDLQLLKGGPEYRRAYLDLYLAQTEPKFRHAFHAYHRLLAQRNEGLRRLRDGLATREEFSVWNETFLSRAAEVVAWRLEAVADLAPLISSYHRRLSGGSEEITLSYLLGGRTPASAARDLEAFMRQESIRREREEIARGLTLVGPHRDDLAIGFAFGYDLRCFASQGQQRTAALAMKLAAVDYLAGRTGEPPIVLLDDVLSEFDDGRKRALLHALTETAQTLITSTGGREFGEVLPSFRAFRVESGKVQEEGSG